MKCNIVTNKQIMACPTLILLPSHWLDVPPGGYCPCLTDDGWERHVVEEGARYHVISWSNLGRKCSTPKCEINRPAGVFDDD
jgi:hypothetical protein